MLRVDRVKSRIPSRSRSITARQPPGLSASMSGAPDGAVTYEPFDVRVGGTYDPDFERTETFVFELWRTGGDQLVNSNTIEQTLSTGDTFSFTFENVMFVEEGEFEVLLAETSALTGGSILAESVIAIEDRTVDIASLSLGELEAIDMNDDGVIDNNDVLDLNDAVQSGRVPTGYPDLNDDGAVNEGEVIFVFFNDPELDSRYQQLQDEANLVDLTCEGVTSSVQPGGTATVTYALESLSSSTEVAVTVDIAVGGQLMGQEQSYTLTPGELRSGITHDFAAPSQTGEFSVEARVVDATEVPSSL